MLVWGAAERGRPGLTLRAAAGRRSPQPGTQRATASGLRAAPALQLEGDAPSGRLRFEARYHFGLGQRVHKHAWGGGHRACRTSSAPTPHHLAPMPGLTVHWLRLRVVVGEPGPQAEAGSVGAGPNPRIREGQRRPAGGTIQAGHGALGEGAR